MEYCISPRSRLEIQTHIGIKNKNHFIKSYLSPLIKSKHLIKTIQDQPNSPNQKYVINTELQ